MPHTPHIQVVARGIAISNGNVLLSSRVNSDRWSIPGGRVEKDESISDALKREFLEECGVTITVERPLLTLENVFEKRGEHIQEVNVYFAISLPSLEVSAKEHDAVFKWVPISSLSSFPLLPNKMRGIIKKISEGESLEPFLSTI